MYGTFNRVYRVVPIHISDFFTFQFLMKENRIWAYSEGRKHRKSNLKFKIQNCFPKLNPDNLGGP